MGKISYDETKKGTVRLQLFYKRAGDGGSPVKREVGKSPWSSCAEVIVSTSVTTRYYIQVGNFCLFGWYRGNKPSRPKLGMRRFFYY